MTTLSGIQRVVRNVLDNVDYASKKLRIKCVPVVFYNGRFHLLAKKDVFELLFNIKEKIKKYSPKILISLLDKLLISYFLQLIFVSFLFRILINLNKNNFLLTDFISKSKDKDNILLLLDSTWNCEMWNDSERFRLLGGKVCAVLYDLIPFTHPNTVEKHTLTLHTRYWKQAPRFIDSVVCISNSVKQDFIAMQEQGKFKGKVDPERVGFFNLGSDFVAKDPILQVLTSDLPYFLVVGTIEPRKNHAIVIDAFEKLWSSGKEANLIFVGSIGWKSEKLLKKIKTHSEYGQRFFMTHGASDRDLIALYLNADALIMPSLAEGFGLPIVEAMRLGTKVICSDIPIFHEIAADHPNYFDPNDSTQLFRIISQLLLSGNQINSKPKKLLKKPMSWRDSTLQLLDTVRNL